MAYKRLSPEDRERIMILRAQNWTMLDIAREVHRDVSAISRELKRHSGPEQPYSAYTAMNAADHKAREHHTQRKLDNPRLWRFVKKMLKLHWSPEQIANALRAQYPEDPSMHVSHETTFLYVQAKST